MFHTKKGFFWKNWAKIPLKICGKVYEIFEHITERFSRFWKITASDFVKINLFDCEHTARAVRRLTLMMRYFRVRRNH